MFLTCYYYYVIHDDDGSRLPRVVCLSLLATIQLPKYRNITVAAVNKKNNNYDVGFPYWNYCCPELIRDGRPQLPQTTWYNIVITVRRYIIIILSFYFRSKAIMNYRFIFGRSSFGPISLLVSAFFQTVYLIFYNLQIPAVWLARIFQRIDSKLLIEIL